MKCNMCFKEFAADEPVFLASDTKDTNIYCETDSPEDSFETSQQLAVVTIGRRIGGGTIQEEVQKPTEKAKEEVIDGVSVVVSEEVNEEILVNVEDIKFEVVKQTKPEVEFKYMFVKDQLKIALKKYVGLVVTEDNLKSVKTDKKALSALKEKINRFRIDEKKILMKPIDEMEDNLKDLAAEIDEVLTPIKEGIKVYDDKKKQVDYEKRLEWLKKLYDENGIREEFQTVVVEHNTKKKDIEAAVLAKQNLQLTKDNEIRVEAQTKQNDINWIKTSVKQQEEEKGIKLNEQKYLNKYELNVDVKSIMSDIIADAQDIKRNAADAATRATRAATRPSRPAEQVVPFPEVEEEVEVDVSEEVIDTEAFNEFSEKIENEYKITEGYKLNEETGELTPIEKVPHTDEEQFEEDLVVPVDKYLFVIKIEETYENLKKLKDFLDDQGLDYDQVGEVEKIEGAE